MKFASSRYNQASTYDARRYELGAKYSSRRYELYSRVEALGLELGIPTLSGLGLNLKPSCALALTRMVRVMGNGKAVSIAASYG